MQAQQDLVASRSHRVLARRVPQAIGLRMVFLSAGAQAEGACAQARQDKAAIGVALC